ncbi:AMP-binding protein [Cryobacterium aureum]|uniref:AMP-binding protein n=1 Tax=Cryobacterium aureum TaxID=995037 RepID=UPI000CF53819|nr:AMP-binding protein [Cryobacterium aureum]
MALDIVGNRTLRDLLDERVERNGDKAFIVYENRDGDVSELSYAQFQARVDGLASGLWDLGIRPGDCVTVFLANCPEILETWFALATIGAAMVPSNIANTVSELGYVLDFSDSVAVITEPRFLDVVGPAADGVPAVRHRILVRSAKAVPGTISLDEVRASTTVRPGITVDSESVVQMLFTSGTTSRPKAVLLTHANALHGGQRESTGLAMDSTDRAITSLPVFHVNAQVITVLATLSVGGTCILLEEYRATKFWDQVRKHRATQVSIVAMQARTLLAQPERETDSQHTVRRTFYALNISVEEKDRFEKRFAVELINAYGLSEAMTLVTIAPVFGPKRWPSIGLPSAGRVVRLVREDGQDVAVGEPGEIVVAGVPGRTIMKGYYKNPEATAKAIRDGWLYTGDSAFADEYGYLYWFDRRVDVIKRAGENISTLEVEGVLSEHPAVAEAAVIGVPDPIRDQAVKAVVVFVVGVTASVDELTEFCAKRLSKFKVPTEYEFRDALPKTSIGKVSKGDLRSEPVSVSVSGS